MNPAAELLTPALVSWIRGDIDTTIRDTVRTLTDTVYDLGYGLVILLGDEDEATIATLAAQYALMVRAQAAALRVTGATAALIDDDFTLEVEVAAEAIDSVAAALDDPDDGEALRDALDEVRFFCGK